LKHEHKKTLVFVVCVVAGLALLIATIGAALALVTGHARWIELAWLSIASSLFGSQKFVANRALKIRTKPLRFGGDGWRC
jgi:hypothetical protein